MSDEYVIRVIRETDQGEVVEGASSYQNPNRVGDVVSALADMFALDGERKIEVEQVGN